MTIEDRTGSVEALVFASQLRAAGERRWWKTRPVLVRGLVLPEENAPPKISVQDIVALDNARIDLPGVISIRVWLGRNGGVDRAAGVGRAVPAQARADAGAAAAGSAARFLGAAGRPGEGSSGPRIQGRGRTDLRSLLRGKSRGLKLSNCIAASELKYSF